LKEATPTMLLAALLLKNGGLTQTHNLT